MNERRLSLRITGLIILAFSVACQTTLKPPPTVESPSPIPSLTVLQAVTSRQVGGDYAPIDITSRFSPTDAIYCVIQVADVERDTKIVARWYFGDTPISEMTYTTKARGSGYVAFELTNQQPWPEGVYRVDILSAGVAVKSVEFRVAR